MNDRVFVRLPLQMRDVEVADGVHGGDDGGVALGALSRGAEVVADLTQGTQDAGAVETLAFAVFAETHGQIVAGAVVRPGAAGCGQVRKVRLGARGADGCVWCG